MTKSEAVVGKSVLKVAVRVVLPAVMSAVPSVPAVNVRVSICACAVTPGVVTVVVVPPSKLVVEQERSSVPPTLTT